MHTLLQATIVAVSLAAPAHKPAAPPQIVAVNLGIMRVLPTAPKPVAVVMPTLHVATEVLAR